MANIFAKQADVKQHPNRNKFDYSKNVYGTYKAGILYPNLCMLCEPTSSFRINTEYFLNFMPTAYPLQSRMRVIQHYFKVPLRLLWENYENWAMGLEEHVVPYIYQSPEYFHTGSLHDYLGVPTTIMSDTPLRVSNMLNGFYSNPPSNQQVFRYEFPEDGMLQQGVVQPTLDGLMSASISTIFDRDIEQYKFSYAITGFRVASNPSTFKTGNGWTYPSGISYSRIVFGFALDISGKVLDAESRIEFKPVGSTATYGSVIGTPKLAIFVSKDKGASINDCYLRYLGGDGTISGSPASRVELIYSDDVEVLRELTSSYKDGTVFAVMLFRFSGGTINVKPQLEWSFPVDLSEPVEMSSVSGVCPYKNPANPDDTDTQPIPAFYARAYEMVYNAFYRNKQGNQPFVVDGETKYNDWLPNHGDGADTYNYQLHRRNWELDAYTSALPSPQLGEAPLVGITALGEITYANEDGSVETIGYASDRKDGGMIVTSTTQDGERQRALVALASSGISIADFRQTNAYQTFMEQTLRSGLTYFDFVRGHFGKGPKDAILQMPEFLGGTSTELAINMISNTSAQGDTPLGSYAGQASAFGKSRHTINVYDDDFYIVLGIMCIVPDPAYSQLLPKQWHIQNPLDLYYPEFGQLGMQPITYGEVCPIQSKLDSLSDPNKKLSDVFGYQRPNYDLVWQADSLHGEFRKTLNRYLVNRRFGSRPELGNEFLQIDPAEVNRSFVVTTAEAGSGDDIAIGQTRHNIIAKRPVHKVVVPSLGR